MQTGVIRAISAQAQDRDDGWASRVSRHAGIPGAGSVRTDTELTLDDEATALARRARKEPDDARVHVQRVDYHVRAGDTDATYGALLDAFIAFGPRGTALRRRLLDGARAVLTPEQTAALTAVPASGLTASAPMPPSLFSVLSRGRQGGPLLQATSTDDTRALEGALLARPWSEPLHRALVTHYRLIGAEDRLVAMRATLLRSGRLLPSVWDLDEPDEHDEPPAATTDDHELGEERWR